MVVNDKKDEGCYPTVLTIVGDALRKPVGTWGNQCTLLVSCVAHSIPRGGNIFLLFYYLNVNKLSNIISVICCSISIRQLLLADG